MYIVTAFLAGLVFGLGLIISGMADPSKVIGFLDLAGNWDPSLAFVMGGAIIVASIAYRFARPDAHSWLGAPLRLPTATHIDRRLVLGSMIFGIGWGLAGYCPGPAIASLSRGATQPWIFVLAMLAGMGVYEILNRRTTQNKAAA